MNIKAALLLLPLLTGCGTVIAPPQIVTVTTVKYVPIPPADTTPCTRPHNKPVTNQDLLVHDQATMRAAECDEKQMKKIRVESDKVPAATTKSAAAKAEDL